MWSADWKIVAAGVVFTGEEVIWYCISCYEDEHATQPTGPVELPTAA
jgi:hypothetical protein